MGASINELMVNDGPEIYYDSAFRTMIESHMSFLRKSGNHEIQPIAEQVGYKHEFDFYGLLQSMKIPSHLHWVILRLNDFNAPTDFKGNYSSIKTPVSSVLDSIVAMHITHSRIK